MKKIFSLFAAILFAGSMMATDVTVDLSKGSHDGSAITWTAADGNITIKQTQGSSSTAVNASYISAPRVYKGHILSFECATNYTITGIEITCNGTYYGNSMTAGTALSGTSVTDNTSAITRTWTTTSGGKHVLSTKNANGESNIYIQNVASESNVQLRFTALKISYIKAATSEPEISAGNVEFGIVIAGKDNAAILPVTGENLTNAITYSLTTGTNFSVSGSLSTTGGNLTINVTATEEGVYEDVLTLVAGTEASKTVNVSAHVIEIAGDGTKANPYTCSDVLKMNNQFSDAAWVKGYILGGAKTEGNPAAIAIDAATGENTAIAIADAPDEASATKIVSVQLGKNVRSVLAAASNVGKLVKVQGTLESYLTVPGVKGVSAEENYEFVSAPTAIDNTADENQAVKTIKNGQLIIEKNGVRYNVMGQVIR